MTACMRADAVRSWGLAATHAPPPHACLAASYPYHPGTSPWHPLTPRRPPLPLRLDPGTLAGWVPARLAVVQTTSSLTFKVAGCVKNVAVVG